MKYFIYAVGLLLVLGVGGFFYLGQKSQSGVAEGLVSGKLVDCPSAPRCVTSEEGAEDSQSVDPLPVAAWAGLPTVIADMGGAVTSQEANYISAEFTSSLFKFVDDVEFRLTPTGIHVRSASRVGYSDRGVNRKRVEAIREKIAG